MHYGAEIMPAAHGVAVTPSNSTDLTREAQALYVGGAGDVAVVFPGASSAVVFVGVPAGTILPVRVQRVNATSTDATNIVALYTRAK